MKQTPEEKAEQKHRKAAEKLAIKAQLFYQNSEKLMKELGSNPYLLKKGLAVTCNAETQQIENRVVMDIQCKISLPVELVK